MSTLRYCFVGHREIIPLNTQDRATMDKNTRHRQSGVQEAVRFWEGANTSVATKHSNMAAINRVVYATKLTKIAYLPALKVQNAIARQHLDELKAKGTSSVENTLLFFEHSPVFTIGIRNKSIDSKERKRLEDLGAEFHFTNRGGLLTFHGPGQLVCYPILNLDCFKKSLRWYVASLENTLIETCKRFDVQAATTCDTGVWVKNNKIAAIGE